MKIVASALLALALLTAAPGPTPPADADKCARGACR